MKNDTKKLEYIDKMLIPFDSDHNQCNLPINRIVLQKDSVYSDVMMELCEGSDVTVNNVLP